MECISPTLGGNKESIYLSIYLSMDVVIIGQLSIIVGLIDCQVIKYVCLIHVLTVSETLPVVTFVVVLLYWCIILNCIDDA